MQQFIETSKNKTQQQNIIHIKTGKHISKEFES